MAKEIVLKVNLEGTEETLNNVSKLEQELEKLNKQRDDLINSSGKGVDEFTKELSSLDSQISKLEKSYQSATGKSEKFEKTQKNLEGITKTISGSINIASSALGAFGVKNEEVEKTLLKVQSAANFSQGLKDLQEGFKALGSTFSVLTKIMLANPFILIATLVASLVVAFVPLEDIIGAITKTVSGLFNGLGQLLGITQETTEAVVDLKSATDDYIDTLVKANAESERNIKILEAQGAGAAVIAAEQLKIISNNQKINETSKQFNENVAELFNGVSIASNLQKQAQDNINTAIEKEKDLATEAKVVQINASKEIADEKKNRINEELNLLKEAEQAKIVQTKEGSFERLTAELNAIQTIEKFQKDNAKELEITQNGITILLAENLEKRKKLEEEYYKFVNTLSNNKVETIKLETKDEEKIRKTSSIVIQQITDGDFRTRKEKRREELIEISKDAEKSQQYAQRTATIISDIANLAFENKKRNLEKGSKEEEKVAKKQFQFNKALQLSLAVMDGFKAITASLAQSPIAIGAVPNPVGIASLAFAAATTAVNIAKIASTKFESTSTNSSGGETTSTPTLNTSGSITPTTFQPDTFGTGVSQQQTFGGTIGSGGGMVLRAYVSESDLQDTNRRLGGIRNASEL